VNAPAEIFILHCAKLDAGVVAAVVSGGRKLRSRDETLEALHPRPMSTQEVGRRCCVAGSQLLRGRCFFFASAAAAAAARFASTAAARPDESGDNIVRLRQLFFPKKQRVEPLALTQFEILVHLIASNGQTSTQIWQLMQTEMSMSNTFG